MTKYSFLEKGCCLLEIFHPKKKLAPNIIGKQILFFLISGSTDIQLINKWHISGNIDIQVKLKNVNIWYLIRIFKFLKLSLQVSSLVYHGDCQNWPLGNILWISFCSWSMMILPCMSNMVLSYCGIHPRFHRVMMDSSLHFALMKHLWMTSVGLWLTRKLPWVASCKNY